MSVRTEIFNALIDRIKETVPEFKRVERGLISLEDKQFLTPSCYVNSERTIFNLEQTTYCHYTKRMLVEIRIYHQTKTNYYEKLDEYVDAIINMITELDGENKLHPAITTVELEELEETINDEYLDGLMEITIRLNINYR